jgi:hypothetical protein
MSFQELNQKKYRTPLIVGLQLYLLIWDQISDRIS